MSAPAVVGRIVAPLVNTNEPESQVIEVHARPFAAIARGDLVCVLETSKGAVEVEAEHDGFVGHIHVAVDDRVIAGQLICEIFDAMPDPAAQPAPAPAAAGPEAASAPGGPRLTNRAARLARDAGLDLAALPTDRILREQDIREAIAAAHPARELDPALVACISRGSVVLFGGGGHAKSLIDLILTSLDLEPLCVLDDRAAPGSEVMGLRVVGGREMLPLLAEAGVRFGVNAVGGLGLISSRIHVGELLTAAGLELPAMVDRTAAVAPSARLGAGVQVFANAAVWSDAEVGDGAIVNTGAVVSHDCRIGANAHITPGALLSGHVEVGEAALVGMGVTTRIGMRIGARAIVGNGCVLNADV
ncbi:MAG: hypothetical protein IT200_09260, partial [Thermoleophilia bacterium]|nr:hypothetical protein [Thermoleophilia bacterium]